MSYRAFKKLMGETNLERKSRWLLGVIVLVLMFSSFFFYARQTETIAYDQLAHTGRTLVPPIVARAHVRQNRELLEGMEEFQQLSEKTWPDNLKGYRYKLFLTDTTRPDRLAEAEDRLILKAFQDDPQRNEETRYLGGENAFVYFGAIRAGQSCLACHRDPAKMEAMAANTPEARRAARDLAKPDLASGDLMGAVSIRLSTEMIEAGFHQNRALLIAIAFGTTILILAGSYLVIRYVIVKPVKHLKSVSERISAGDSTVRSDIQTGDEFEDLSVAFNRMLTNLTQMQERNRGLIADLDAKVDELARANIELFSSNKMKADFLSTMSHELRTPLNSVIGFSENLLNAENLTDRQKRWAANILTSGQQLLALINDILDLAKVEAGKMTMRPEAIAPAAFCERMATLFRAAAEKKEIELVVKCADDLPELRQDAGKLQQIVSNLLSNAVKFTPDGGRITVSAEIQGPNFVLTVADTGVGIAPEEQELVFQKFRQASNPLTREQGGTGLGLSIVRELARLLGGEVSLHSELGRGTTFTVTVATHLKADPLAAYETP
jgi:signal transduction histidine kinase